MHAPAKVTKRNLSHGEFYKLCNWMGMAKATIEKELPTYAALAMTAEKALGFEISHHSIASASEAIGLTWRPKFSREGGSPGIDRFNSIFRDLATLAQIVTDLHAKCGEQAPAQLREMFERLG